ncbi:GDNF family receptor alpha-1a isoform X1 [Clarias gariepinus]|uniref:GDNF family receptor alpha-1a isoform X1 n=1 Tax=Clarias gariepinus TaxID=13013 RepID=UPI00234DCADC|nr:GDNF family receptor alpha-1a isoform X1 [Clarias gariepinus]XP_053358243.1 GDNF family receptor alpha-1a isoform X1 [Clarias gariepinus]
MILSTVCVLLPLLDVLLSAEKSVFAAASRMDCVGASELCLKEPGCSTKYRTMRQCITGQEGNISVEGRDECRSALEALKQSPLYNCRCKRGMKKEKNCLRIYWGLYQHLKGNDLLEESPYEPVTSRGSDIFRLAPMFSEGDMNSDPRSAPDTMTPGHNPGRNKRSNTAWAIPGDLLTKDNNCLSAAKACNLNDTCKKYRSAYISPCTSRVSTAEVCNKRKCHKALRQFFDKVPARHSYGMLYCSCPPNDQVACSERRRQTIVPACSYEEKEKPNCLALQVTCKSNYICRSRLADFFSNCQAEPRSLSGCLKENYADCLLSYSGLIGTVMTPNYLRSPKISVSPFCDCSNSGNSKEDCERFTEFFTDNACLRNAIRAFGNGTDVSLWQSAPVQSTTPSHTSRVRGKLLNVGPDMNSNQLNPEDSLYQLCGNLQAQNMKTNQTKNLVCVDTQIDNPSSSNSFSGNSASRSGFSTLLLLLLSSFHCSLALLPLNLIL